LAPSVAEVEFLESRALLTVTYHGGALLPAVEAQAVYLGGDWSTNSSLTSQTSQVDKFVSTIVNSPYMDMLTNAGYNVGRGTASAGVIDNVTLNKSTAASGGVTDLQIQKDLQAMISAGQVQTPDANRLYIVYVEPGVVVHLDSSDASNTTFLGYHGAFAGTAAGKAVDIHYDVIPYPGSPNFSPQSQGFSSAFNEMTTVTSHELAEAVTDPNVNYKALGWYDDNLNGEIGDLTSKTTTLSGYEVQDLVGKNDNVISPSTSTPPSTVVGTPTLTATATNTTTVQLSWSTVSGSPQGYRLYETIGSTTTTINLSVSATSDTITGLTAGSKVSFKLEAYNATSTADSSVVSVTLPSSSPPPSSTLAAPHVSGSALNPFSDLLTWNRVSGAQGYRIYWWDGTEAVLLGTVGSRATSVQIVGLSPGETDSFLVEAFNSTAVADSAWVTITTPSFFFGANQGNDVNHDKGHGCG
jgi:hypothetical protein